MTEEKTAQAEDSSGAAPQSEEGLAIQFAEEDSPATEPEATGTEGTENYLGDYKTREDAEKAIAETKRAMHEAKEEAAAYRKALEIAGTEKTPEQTVGFGQPDPSTAQAQIEEQLQSNPVGTIAQMQQYAINQAFAERERRGAERMAEFNKFASLPEYAEVAPQVLQHMAVNPDTNMEMEFLKARLNHVTTTQATQHVTDEANAKRMHVESGSSKQPENIIQVQLEGKANDVHRVFNDSEEEKRALHTRLAKMKQDGLGRGDHVSIDQWMKYGGGTNG